MKIQCPCGAKYAFDITPEMAGKPVQFICEKCGLDSSDFVNELLQQELAGQTSSPTPPAPVAETARLKIARAEQPAAPSNETEAVPETSRYCPRHPGVPVTNRCAVCQKPICPKCMELFGRVCSAFCKARAEAQNIKVPVYAGQKRLVEARFWRRAGAIFSAVTVAAVLAVGFWIWYAWFGSVPKPVFSVRFDQRAFTGESKFCTNNQIVFLHGGTLARGDIRSKKEIWSRELVTQQQIADAVAHENELSKGFEHTFSQDKLSQMVGTEMTSGLHLHVSGRNIWVIAPDKLTHYDWDTGSVLQEIPISEESGGFVSQADELLVLNKSEAGRQLVTHINLANGETHTEEIGGPAAVTPGTIAATSTQNAPTAGLPIGGPGTDSGGPMNPATVAVQAQNLPLPARIALPALLANSAHQERIQAELNDQSPQQHTAIQSHPAAPATGYFTLIPDNPGYVEFSVRLLESRMVTREAMKAPPKKSALNGDLTAQNTSDAINETLNEMQRNRGGDTVTEDESRYQVVIRRPDAARTPDWTGEVTGPPSLFPLKTVNVLTAGKTVIVFDKTNKKLWQAALTYNVTGGSGALDEDARPFGSGPCVEQGDTLYVFDQAVLTAFDLATGNARWRMPSVGVVGLFFDDKGMLYVNTTTASPENIKYSRQIDVTQKIKAILLKMDPRTGRTLWSAKPGGFISYLSGKFIYTVQWYQPSDEDVSTAEMAGLVPNPPYLQIRRISPDDGHVLWLYQQDRAPLDVQFDGNSIGLVFKKEVQVLKFFSL